MATRQPVKYDNAQHDVFAPSDTMPVGIAPLVVGGALEGNGTTGSPLRLVVEAGTPATQGPPGPEGQPPATQDGGGLRWTYNQITNTLSIEAVISSDPNNCLEVRADGLFRACP